MSQNKSFTIISLGCPKNLVDSEVFCSIFKESGYTFTHAVEKANIVLINTCGFIQDAQEEAIMTILETAKTINNSPSFGGGRGRVDKTLIVTGCLVKRFKDELITDIPEVDVWLDLKDFSRLKQIVNAPTNTLTQRELLTPKHYAYLRVSDGCDNKCSYCAIPSIRGNHKSEPIDTLLEEAKYLAGKGVKELIINAQDTTKYGYDLYGESALIELLKRIEEMSLFPWLRLLYLHPAHLTEKMILQLAEFKTLLPYFDIPLQHINSDILSAMNRKVDPETIIKRLYLLRETFPDCAIRTTFITGFPSETKQQFKELELFIKDFKFTRLGVFTYSHEIGTPAYDLTPLVPFRTAQKRKDKLMAIQQPISSEIMSGYIGKTLEVIIDKDSDEEGFTHEGRSYMDAPEIDGKVYIQNGRYEIGDIVKVKITDAWEYDLVM